MNDECSVSIPVTAIVVTPADLFEQAIARTPLCVSPETRVQTVVAYLCHPRSPNDPPRPGPAHPTHPLETQLDCVLIVQARQLVGIFTAKDAARWQRQTPSDGDRSIATVMTTPVITLQETEFTDPFVALTRLHQHQIRYLPLLNAAQEITGILTDTSLVQLGQALYQWQQEVIQTQAQQFQAQIAQNASDRAQAEAALQHSDIQFQQTLAALQHSESKHRVLIDTLPDLIMRISGDGYYLDFFPSDTFKVLGSSEIVGESIFAGSLPQDLAERRMYFIQRALQTKCLQIYEQQLLIDDKLRTEEVRVTVCGDDEVLLIVRDITDRKEVETALLQLNQDLETKVKQRTQSLKESEERFRQIFEQSPLGIAITDLDGHVVRANSRLVATLGYTKTSEVLGLSIQELLCVAPSSQGLLPLQQLLEQTLSVIAFESQPIAKDGRTLWVNITSALIFSANFPSAIIHLVEDITERKQIDQQLRNLSARLTLAVQAGEIGIWEWHTATNEVVWDGRMHELYGVQPADFSGTYDDWFSRVHPEDRAIVAAATQKACQGKCEYDIEFRVVHPDNTIRFIKAGGLIQRDKQGYSQRMIGVNFDITKHKQTQAVISQYACEVEDLYNNAPCGYHSLDTHGRFIKINHTTLQWLGYDREEVLGRSFEEFLTEESCQMFRSHYATFKRQGAMQDIELDLIHKDRTRFPVLLNATAVYHPDGMYLYSRSTLFDHRQLKTASTNLKRQLVAMEAAVDGIAILDRHTYTYVNQAHLELFGYIHREELIGKSWTILYSPEDIAWFEQQIFLHLHHQGFWQGEVKGVRKDGSTFIQGLSLTLTEKGEMICVCRNITPQKQAEEQLRQINEQLTLTNTELYRATRLRDEFLANISHELRTPLNAILGMSESLQEEVFGHITSRQEEAVRTIVQSGSHLLELINDILDLSKAEANRLELQLGPTAISDLCYSSLAFIKHQALQKNLHLMSTIPQFLPDIVLDERRVRQVLINLLTNAVKFTPDGGTIQLIVRSEQQPDQSVLYISVIDTGIGIAPKDIDKLFQPFSQIDSSFNRRYAGTGLGLVLVRRLIDLHYGTVSVTSEPGQGSCFTICLPYPTYPATPPEAERTRTLDGMIAPYPNPAHTEAPESNPFRIRACHITHSTEPPPIPLILLAEDNEANIATISSYLNARGYQIIVARNGKEAVAIAQSQQPDLVLMDIQMPEMDGLEAIQHIRADHDLRQLPIIALTALAMAGDRDKCLAAGANDYCTKPVKLKHLVASIRGLLTPQNHLKATSEI